MRPGRLWTHWDPDTKQFTLQFFYSHQRSAQPRPSATPAAQGAASGANVPNPLNPYGAPAIHKPTYVQ
ncbi:CWF complex protein sap62 [Spiromyces aspiralis]|uniref:CWF complex protein sap62 n=1 Tax=Spiromyces aspiralis TaxID=68401 RepID=A0ACC1HAV3_9FUNG|nr:CWF complex protein sap62 [Spiromyces aspiralis]